MVDSVFRYTLDEVITRRVPGRYGFVIQRNPKRFSHRRKPAEVKSICQPFNPQLFNFNKVKKSEVHCTLFIEKRILNCMFKT